MPGRRHSILLVVFLLLLSLTSITLRPSCAQDAGDNSPSPSKSNTASSLSGSPGDRPADHSTEITTVGCIGIDDYFFNDSSEYSLVGNDDEIAGHGSDWVRVRGKRILQTEDGPPNLKVLDIATISKSQDAILDPKLRNPSQWHTHLNEPLGLRLSIPKEINRLDEDRTNYQLVPGFIKNDHVIHVLSFEIPQKIYLPQPYRGIERTHLQTENPPRTNFGAGAFEVFVNPEITDAATCKKFDPQYSGGLSSRSINGFDYTVLNTISGPGEDFDFFHTFQNGHCFEINFDLEFARAGGDDITCAIEGADSDALETLLLSKISFFQPKAAAATTVH